MKNKKEVYILQVSKAAHRHNLIAKEEASHLLQVFAPMVANDQRNIVQRHLDDIWLKAPIIPKGLKGSFLMWEIKRVGGEIVDYVPYTGEITLEA